MHVLNILFIYRHLSQSVFTSSWQDGIGIIDQKYPTSGKCLKRHIVTDWSGWIFMRGKLFSRIASSLPCASASPDFAKSEIFSFNFSQSSSKTDWWKSSLFKPWRSWNKRINKSSSQYSPCHVENRLTSVTEQSVCQSQVQVKNDSAEHKCWRLDQSWPIKSKYRSRTWTWRKGACRGIWSVVATRLNMPTDKDQNVKNDDYRAAKSKNQAYSPRSGKAGCREGSNMLFSCWNSSIAPSGSVVLVKASCKKVLPAIPISSKPCAITQVND